MSARKTKNRTDLPRLLFQAGLFYGIMKKAEKLLET